ncbi:uncharacterized protein LOC119911536 [Micropterus salmoides]|uniref:uncharacterized protein LOC119903170 n=1 Tax=Micropterus salmoides TaxID=27706 RepID=UPI0018ED823F|nr:uncharacterized protein LOC119903170 [Micropterus salmoides]XP_038586365.1 uncharacterized protein LOC119911533 [Micropterus salmoides]XP_038586366.1 uncharacterized protein LOC119911535 [Micropterus salmoides]XP_038586367.1 uncharacterized protein LOC119911535 [Micropterus salmoides]XP_038586369.1 uncharacterized protein LOC119911535 [Micropterus salmoides]XP_038586370.1 uncharacterized protein LOC119911536 [Micropterus salmoides]XP_038586371.1 uncharacterized protein LOC119911536 [Microp
MVSSGFCREEQLLTLGIVRLLDDRYAALPRPGRVLQMIVTNLRNRPLSSTSVASMRESILSMYHHLITGSKDFPLIPFKGSLRTRQTATPFVPVDQEERENTTPSLTDEPAGILVPTAGLSSSAPNILTAAHPERTELGALRADPRNCVRRMEFDGETVTRVISTGSRFEGTEVTNRWRVSDYSGDGRILMSVLCQFTRESTYCARTLRKKRKGTEEESSTRPKKRLRV